MKRQERTAIELRNDDKLYTTYLRYYIRKAQVHGWVVAYDEFVHMVNPVMRGSAFNWDKFENMCASRAKTSVWQGFTDKQWNKYGPLLKEDAAESARFAAREILRSSGVQTWLPL